MKGTTRINIVMAVLTLISVMILSTVTAAAATIKYDKKYECDGSVIVRYSITRGDKSKGKPYTLTFRSDNYESGEIMIDNETYDITKTYLVEKNSFLVTSFRHNDESFKLMQIMESTPPYIAEEDRTDSDVLSWTAEYEVIHNHIYKETVKKKASFSEDGLLATKCEICSEDGEDKVIPQIPKSAIDINPKSFTYNGKAKKPHMTVSKGYEGYLDILGRARIAYSNNVNAGIGIMEISFLKDDPRYTGSKQFKFKIGKASSRLSIQKTKAVVKIKRSVKKAKTLKMKKWLKVKNAKGKLSYKAQSGHKGIKVDRNNGALTIKKTVSPGTYRIKVTVTEKESQNYKGKTITKIKTIRVIN